MTTFEAAAYFDTKWNFGCRSYFVSSLFYTSVMLVYPGDPFKGMQFLSFTTLMVMPVTSVSTEATQLFSFSHCLGLFKMEVIPVTDIKISFWFLSYPVAWSVWIEEASHLSPVSWPSPPPCQSLFLSNPTTRLPLYTHRISVSLFSALQWR